MQHGAQGFELSFRDQCDALGADLHIRHLADLGVPAVRRERSDGDVGFRRLVLLVAVGQVLLGILLRRNLCGLLLRHRRLTRRLLLGAWRLLVVLGLGFGLGLLPSSSAVQGLS